MLALEKDHVLLPGIDEDELIAAIQARTHGEKTGVGPDIGTLPNRFVARLQDGNGGEACVKALTKAWEAIADEVLAYINGEEPLIESGEGSIWYRQVSHLWEGIWVIGEEGYRLDQRKNFRTYFPPTEAGEKCTVCGERQELSGITGPNHSRINIKVWWDNTIRGKMHDLDLRKTERLCAVCLIKRVLPIVSDKIFGWQIPLFYPSTAYMATIDWLIRVLQKAKEREDVRIAANEFVRTAIKHLGMEYQVAERYTQILGVDEALTESGVNTRIAELDGDVFFIESLLGDELDLGDQAKRELIDSLNNLHRVLRENGVSNPKPSPFYAMMLMDGDGMGKLLAGRSLDERQKISSALTRFSKSVPKIVQEHNGKLIYAGGDDVFALLPVDSALACASRCRQAYQLAFEELASFVSPGLATISAAINYAHINTALGVVVRDSHRLLDDVAKNKTGRNAVACRVWKRGGPILTWSQPWQVSEYGNLIQKIQDTFQNEQKDSNRYSSKFFYKFEDVFKIAQDGKGGLALPVDQIEKLLIVEYLANRENRWKPEHTDEDKRRIALEYVRPLLKLCRETHRELRIEEAHGKTCPIEAYWSSIFKVDGALLVRFLSQKEV